MHFKYTGAVTFSNCNTYDLKLARVLLLTTGSTGTVVVGGKARYLQTRYHVTQSTGNTVLTLDVPVSLFRATLRATVTIRGNLHSFLFQHV